MGKSLHYQYDLMEIVTTYLKTKDEMILHPLSKQELINAFILLAGMK